MKKYITIAALLAAGATFANADADFSSAFKITDLSQSSSNSTFNYNGNGTITSATGGNIAAGSGQVSISLKFDLDSAKNAAQASSVHISLIELGNIGIGLTSNGLVALNGGNPWQTQFGTAQYSSLVDQLVVTFDPTTLTNQGGGTQLYNGSTGTNIKGWNQLGSSSSVTTGYPSITVNTEYLSEVCIATGIASGAQIKQMSSIPEPSAFGLLAGLGALALVSARRRRK